MNSKIEIGVVGLGAWGSALLVHLARKGYSVTGWGRSVEVSCTDKRVSSRLANLPTNASITDDLSTVTHLPIVVVALPAQALAVVGITYTGGLLVSATKGIEPHSRTSPLQYYQSVGFPPHACCVLSGPSFSSDLLAGRPISVVAASADLASAERIAEIFSNESMRVYSSDDPNGVELGGILKNIIAVAAGVSDGMNCGPSARAALITRGLTEIIRLATTLGARRETLVGLSGLGDLLMTATDDQSRNRTVGLRLGRGESIEEIASSLGSVAEGVATAPLALELARKHSIEMPICEQVVALLRREISPHELVRRLMQRPLKKE